VFVVTTALSTDAVHHLTSSPQGERIFREMAILLDEIDVKLLRELELDAGRSNVELSRLVGLSAAATLNRVKRLRESEAIRRISSRLDSAAGGLTVPRYGA